MNLLITGGAGFIGSAVVRRAVRDGLKVVNLDKLTYAGNLDSLSAVSKSSNYTFEQIDICDYAGLQQVFAKYQPDAVMHLAAESHVDRSIDGPTAFIQTNVIGTFNLLEVCRSYFASLDPARKSKFRFHHISTDEVYGSLGDTGAFSETTSYQPNSPYSASKAGSDHMVRAWHHTYGLPVVTTNCSNNYGPYQFPEKLMPLMILNGLEGKPLPIYGKGENVRDWLFVDDHVDALFTVLKKGRVGEVYNIGGNSEAKNKDIVHAICETLDELAPNQKIGPRKNLITYVQDRPGHDQRYAIDASKIKTELGWQPSRDLKSGLRSTVEWYIENKEGWCKRVLDGSYRLERLGLSGGGAK